MSKYICIASSPQNTLTQLSVSIWMFGLFSKSLKNSFGYESKWFGLLNHGKKYKYICVKHNRIRSLNRDAVVFQMFSSIFQLLEEKWGNRYASQLSIYLGSQEREELRSSVVFSFRLGTISLLCFMFLLLMVLTVSIPSLQYYAKMLFFFSPNSLKHTDGFFLYI